MKPDLINRITNRGSRDEVPRIVEIYRDYDAEPANRFKIVLRVPGRATETFAASTEQAANATADRLISDAEIRGYRVGEGE